VEDSIAACGKLADCCLELGKQDEQLRYVFKSFEYDTPRAEFCCRLGYHFMQQNRIKEAIFWYKLATQLEQPKDSWGNISHACWTWLPHIQLCVCYDKVGQHELAYRHNEMAAAFIPDDPKIIHNRKYFNRIFKSLDKQAAIQEDVTQIRT